MNRFSNWHIQRKVIQEMQALPDHILGEIGVDRNHIPDHVKAHCVPGYSPMVEKHRIESFQTNLPSPGGVA